VRRADSFWGRGPKTQGWGPAGFTPAGAGAKPPKTAKLAIEGRDYIVRDGDVIHFRFNV